MNNFVLQHKMDKVKTEPDSINHTSPVFPPSVPELHDINDEGPVLFDVLQKGLKVRFSFYSSVNHIPLTYMRRNSSIWRGS
jgi:hypothetical protein